MAIGFLYGLNTSFTMTVYIETYIESHYIGLFCILHAFYRNTTFVAYASLRVKGKKLVTFNYGIIVNVWCVWVALGMLQVTFSCAIGNIPEVLQMNWSLLLVSVCTPQYIVVNMYSGWICVTDCFCVQVCDNTDKGFVVVNQKVGWYSSLVHSHVMCCTVCTCVSMCIPIHYGM